MTPFPSRVTRLGVPFVLVIQAACGGDASGPKHTATSIEANSSTTITAAAGSAALERPSVIVRDENGDPMAGASVVFRVTSGDGAVGGSTVTTSSTGVATVGTWTLGQTATTNTIEATTGGLPAVTFTANAGDPCDVSFPFSLSANNNGKLSLADCQVSDGSFVDFWAVTIPTMGMYEFGQTSPRVDSFLLLLTTDFHVIAQNNNAPTGTTHDSMLRAILPAGQFLVGANSLNALETGDYALSSVALPAQQVSNCENMFAVPGITTQQSLQTSDCSEGALYTDVYIVYLRAGQSVTVTMTSSAIDSYLELYSLQGTPTLVAANDDADGTTKNSTIMYTAPILGYYRVNARSAASGTTGAYTLTIQ